MSRIFGVAALQLAPIALDPEGCFEKLSFAARHVVETAPSVRLLVFPELFLTGTSVGPRHVPADYLDSVAEPIPGPMSDRLCELAVQTGRWLVPGSYVERDGEHLYNTALAISPQGTIAAKYRKLFPWMPFERMSPGDEHVTFDIPGLGSAGLAICYDGWVPEIGRTLAWMGAEIIIQPTYTYTSDREQEVVLARANAIVNQAYVINPNIGQSFGPGRSVVIDPEGRVLAQAGSGEEILTLAIDLDLVSTVREHGTMGTNAVWKQLRDFPPPFPPGRLGYASGAVMEGLGPLRARVGRTPPLAAPAGDGSANSTRHNNDITGGGTE